MVATPSVESSNKRGESKGVLEAIGGMEKSIRKKKERIYFQSREKWNALKWR